MTNESKDKKKWRAMWPLWLGYHLVAVGRGTFHDAVEVNGKWAKQLNGRYWYLDKGLLAKDA